MDRGERRIIVAVKLVSRMLGTWLELDPRPLAELWKVGKDDDLKEIWSEIEEFDRGDDVGVALVVDRGSNVKMPGAHQAVLYCKRLARRFPRPQKDEKAGPLEHVVVPEEGIIAYVRVDGGA